MRDFSRREFFTSLGLMGALASEAVSAQKKKTQAKKKPLDPLRGSKRSMEKQRGIAEREDLSYLDNEAQLKEFVRKGLMVPLPNNKDIGLDPYLAMEGDINDKAGKKIGRKYNRAFCRPWVRKFLEDLASEYRKSNPIGPKLMVTSAIRPRDVQNSLQDINPNASSKSVHLTGSVIDLVYGNVPERNFDGSFVWETDMKTKKRKVRTLYSGLSKEQKDWVAQRLKNLELNLKTIEATLERREPCFHIMVSKEYK